jgi:hypothetical protein
MFRYLVPVILIFSLQQTVFAQPPSRPMAPQLKGAELYSWQDANTGAWRFSLLPGTNRVKTLAEITDRTRTLDLVTLKRRIGALAEGEHVYWSTGKPYRPLAYPDATITEELVNFAAERRVRLVVPQ